MINDMKKMIWSAAVLAAMLLSCEMAEVDDVNVGNKETACLEVKMATGETKVSGEGGDEEKAVSSYQVLVFDRTDRLLEAYATPAPTALSVNIRCTTGPKEVVVLANAPDVSSIVSYDSFLKTKSLLSDNAAGALVMEGHASPELSVSGNSVTVDVRRMVSKVVLDKVMVDFETDAYDKMDFILKEVYLTNVAGDKSYLSETADPASWYNKIVRTPDAKVDAMVYENLGEVNLKDTKQYTVKHHFYCYPNPYTQDTFSPVAWSPRPTRLVLVAELGGKTCYYPVSLPELKQNLRYYVTLNIIRPGASSPEQDMEKYPATININIVEWNGLESVTETI